MHPLCARVRSPPQVAMRQILDAILCEHGQARMDALSRATHSPSHGAARKAVGCETSRDGSGVRNQNMGEQRGEGSARGKLQAGLKTAKDFVRVEASLGGRIAGQAPVDNDEVKKV